MFLLSVIAIHLFGDSDSQRVNVSNEVDVSEHNVMELEAIYTSMILGQYYNGSVDGVNQQSNFSMVKTALDVARSEHISAMYEQQAYADNNTNARLEYIEYMNNVANERVSDLQELQTALYEGETLDRVISAVNNTDVRDVNNQLVRAEMYQQELERAEMFWTEANDTKELIMEAEEEAAKENEEDYTRVEEASALKFDNNRLATMATAKERMDELRKLRGVTANGKSLGQMKEEESKLRSLIAGFKSDLDHLSAAPASDKTNKRRSEAQYRLSEVRNRLSTNLAEQGAAKLMDGVSDSIQDSFGSLMGDII